MRKQLELLIVLQDLMVMKRELGNRETVEKLEEMGFRISRQEAIEQAVQEIVRQLDPDVHRTFQRVAQKYERPLVPVKNGTCLGCFVAMPTAQSSKLSRSGRLELCSNCGRIIYWFD